MMLLFQLKLTPHQTRARCFRGIMASGQSLPNRSYNSSDGKAKTTIEDVFHLNDKKKATLPSAQAPWELSWQMNERNVQWIDDLKVKLIKKIAAEEMNLTEEQFDEKLSLLTDVLPGVDSRIAKMPPKIIAQLIYHSQSIGLKLLELKGIFPEADVAILAGSRPSLLLSESLSDVKEAAARLKELLPNSNVDYMVQQYPMLLNIASLEEAIRDAHRLLPNSDFEQVMQNNPSMILSLQKGKDMIAYDEVPTWKNPYRTH